MRREGIAVQWQVRVKEEPGGVVVTHEVDDGYVTHNHPTISQKYLTHGWSHRQVILITVIGHGWYACLYKHMMHPVIRIKHAIPYGCVTTAEAVGGALPDLKTPSRGAENDVSNSTQSSDPYSSASLGRSIPSLNATTPLQLTTCVKVKDEPDVA